MHFKWMLRIEMPDQTFKRTSSLETLVLTHNYSLEEARRQGLELGMWFFTTSLSKDQGYL